MLSCTHPFFFTSHPRARSTQNLVAASSQSPLHFTMLSNPLHRFSGYNGLPSSNMLSNRHIPSNHMHASSLDTLTHGSQYALQQLQQHVDVHQNHLHRNNNSKHRQHPYNGLGAANSRSIGVSGPIRRRISRACDQCNQLRTKCDGQAPCAHCVGEYVALLLMQLAHGI